MLEYMGFQEVHANVYIKKYLEFDCDIEVNFTSRTISYPTLKGMVVNDLTTCNFEKNENFVVLECINSLLIKGYRPEHIELERKWTLGHLPKSGKSDICVKDINGENILFIIECKTFGEKYNEELSNLKANGGQLFSYWQQERSCKWLCLYSSDFSSGNVLRDGIIINCSDDPNLVLLSKKDKTIELYRNAYSAPQLYKVWTETYNSKLWELIIFSNDSIAYKIGVRPLRKSDLKELDGNNKLSRSFQEILRHNNVSDKENAFNCLIALFICKLVDELCSNDTDEVSFQYKQGTDTFESLQDRLQQLHQRGMQEFMQESVYYVPSNYAESLFSNYNGNHRLQAIEELNNTIRILKFYTNNDFSFKDVHNEELFLQNGKILVEVIQLFERYKIVYPSKQQFLGNLFENLLSDGFRQDEGQYFTPTPITRFIWECLPIEKFFINNSKYPKIIDYACGAGHFLTEGIDAINYLIPSENNDWVRDSIFGIEKDYRLTRVAKIALFMNSAGGGNVIFGDGLDNNPSRKISNESFDFLVANPPYAVDGFKPHLRLKENSLSLIDSITDKSSEIESLFVERIAQLLKPNGIAAVVLPSTILTNDTSYTFAREILLKNFKIHAIVSLAEKTFGATPTSTVILFLEKFNYPPHCDSLKLDVVNQILSLNFDNDWNDKNDLDAYLNYQELDLTEYTQLLSGEIFYRREHLSEYASLYIKTFEKSKAYKQLLLSKSYKELTSIEQKNIVIHKFKCFVHSIERDKLLYFCLVKGQKTIVVTCPVDNASKQNFLGFKWTKKNKSLNLEYVNEGGLLYDPNERFSNERIAGIILSHFNNQPYDISEFEDGIIKEIATLDMMNFSGTEFIKDLNVSADIRISFKCKYPKRFLSSLLDEIGGQWIDSGGNLVTVKVIKGTNFTKDGHSNYSDITSIEVDSNKFEKRKLQKGDIIIEKSGGSSRQAVGRVLYFNLNDTDFTCSNFTARLRIKSDKTNIVISQYIYILLNQIYMRGLTFGYQTGKSNLKNLNLKRFLSIKIPMPPKIIQESIISDWMVIDEQFLTKRMSINEYCSLIDVMLKKYDIVIE